MRNKFMSYEYGVLSSAKWNISDFSVQGNISFMNILNGSGPNIYPLGIPRRTSDQLR